MKKRQLLISVLAGLFVGQIFAEGELPFSVVNTLRIGYDDNIDRNPNPEGSAYIEDVIDLAFRAALTDRTDLILKSRFRYRSDADDNNLYPNLYAVLTHSVSSRFLVQLSDKYTSGSKTSTFAPGRHDYFENTVSLVPSYVLSPKDEISVPVSYTIERNDDIIDQEDTDILTGGVTWKRTLSPQRTWAALHVRQVMVDYVNRDSSYDSTRISGELSHTFNPEWHGSVELGISFDETEFSVSNAPMSSSSQNPFVNAGLSFDPTPRTRFTADVSHKYKESDSVFYTGETISEIRLGAQHDFTAKIMGKVTGRYQESDRERADNETGGGDTSEERFDLDFLLRYKLNRLNFIELGLRHSEKSYDNSTRDWDQNMIDIGWRVEL